MKTAYSFVVLRYVHDVMTGEFVNIGVALYAPAASILDKANRWLGRVMNLQDAPDTFRLHLLLGEPSLERLRPAHTKAENILHKMPGDPVFVRENEAKDFSESLAAEMAAHDESA